MNERTASPSLATTPGRPITLSFGELAEWIENVANGDAFNRRVDRPLTMTQRGVALTLALQECPEFGVTPRELLVNEALNPSDVAAPAELLAALDALIARGLVNRDGWPVNAS